MEPRKCCARERLTRFEIGDVENEISNAQYESGVVEFMRKFQLMKKKNQLIVIELDLIALKQELWLLGRDLQIFELSPVVNLYNV